MSAGRKSRKGGPVGRPKGVTPPRLVARERKGRSSIFYIYHGTHQESTKTSDPKKAQIAFAAYLARRDADVRHAVPRLATIGEMIDERRASTTDRESSKARRLEAYDERLREFWGDLRMSDIQPDSCQRYRETRFNLHKPGVLAASGTVRVELKRLRTLVNGFCESHGIADRPVVVLPPAGVPRGRWLWREEVARLICAARGRTWDRVNGGWRRDADGRLALVGPEHRALARPLVRLILLGAFTGTREDAMRRATWRRAADRPNIDVDKETFHRRGPSEPVTKKRRPPVHLCPELFRLVLRWERFDRVRHFNAVIHDDNGAPLEVWDLIARFAKVRRRSGLGRDVIIHTLRHTCATWLLHGGATLEVTAAYMGVTVEELGRVYAQADVEFTAEPAKALAEWGRPKRPGQERPQEAEAGKAAEVAPTLPPVRHGGRGMAAGS